MLRLKVPTKLRNLEATLIVFAMIVTSAALALVDLGTTGKLNPPIIGLTLGLGAIVLAMHVAQRFVARDADPLILPIVTLLNGLGIVMIHRLDISAGLTGWQANATRQMVWTAIATVVAINDDKIAVRTDSGVELSFIKRAIAGRYNPPAAIVESAPEADTEAEGQ
jgi:hypothetical protein